MKKVEMNKKMKEEIRKAQKSAKEEAGEFKKFISKGNVVDMCRCYYWWIFWKDCY